MNDLARAALKAVEWTRKRDALIRDAHTSGLSLRTIAAQAGLSHTAIAKIVERERG